MSADKLTNWSYGGLVAALVVSNVTVFAADLPKSVVAPGATLQKLAGEFQFTEGPSHNSAGDVYFTDQPNNRIMKWSREGKLSTYLQPAGRANGMYFDSKGNLLAC